ncbi:MAG: hypothetical protein KDA45_02420 [Planctomycetales bacterium]|nr:hypothetical protein [Planctomycetales bacterium]
MPLDGEKLDELLSGFVDAELSPAELKLFAEAVEGNASLQQRVEQLRRQRNELHGLGVQLSAPGGLPNSFADRVIAAARQQAAQSGLPPSHHVRRGGIQPTVSPAAPASLRRRRRALFAGAWAAVVAALLLLSLYIPQLIPGERPASVSEPRMLAETQPVEAIAAPAAVAADADQSETQAYVGQQARGARVMYLLVVDVRMTRSALDNNVLGHVLASSGIPLARPLAASPRAQQALYDSRMIVRPGGGAPEESVLYLVHASMPAVDTALREVWRDDGNFPNVRFDVAFDSPQTRLVEELLQGQRHSSTASFAAPLAVSAAEGASEDSRPSPFPGSSAAVQYVSRSSRAQGWSADQAPLSAGDSMAWVIIVGRVSE